MLDQSLQNRKGPEAPLRHRTNGCSPSAAGASPYHERNFIAHGPFFPFQSCAFIPTGTASVKRGLSFSGARQSLPSHAQLHAFRWPGSNEKSRFPLQTGAAMPFLRENNGNWSPLKIAAFAGAIAPALWLLTRVAFGDLGARPVTVALHFCGDWAVRFVLISLAITPARRLFAAPRLIQARRTLGVAAFFYALCHFSLYVTDQMFDVQKVASEIALGVTSTDAAVRRLKQRWGTLHRLVYFIATLAVVHFMMQKKLDIYEPTWMAGLLFWLLAYRVVQKRMREVTVPALLALAFASTLFTMLAEAAWYGVLTGVSPLRILAANFDPTMDVRPAWWVLLATVGIVFLHLAAKWLWPLPARPSRPAAPQPELKPAE